MVDYLMASRTKEHFQGQLLRDHPDIVSIAPRLKRDAQGQPTAEAVIVIGVKKINPLRLGPGAGARPPSAALPTRLPVVNAQGVEEKGHFVEVIIEDEGEIVAQAFTAKQRP
jgi:hypothetical protein